MPYFNIAFASSRLILPFMTGHACKRFWWAAKYPHVQLEDILEVIWFNCRHFKCYMCASNGIHFRLTNGCSGESVKVLGQKIYLLQGIWTLNLRIHAKLSIDIGLVPIHFCFAISYFTKQTNRSIAVAFGSLTDASFKDSRFKECHHHHPHSPISGNRTIISVDSVVYCFHRWNV